MKRIIYITLAGLLGSVGVQAQQERRLLTMEEAVLGTGIQVENINCSWDMGGSVYRYTLDGVEHHIDARTGKEMGEPAAKLKDTKKDYFKAFSRNGQVWYLDADSVEHQVTDFNQDGIVCGQTVSRNEFGIDGGIFVSPDRRKIAFYKKDESRVTLFPLLDITTRTGSLKEIRYPMNGMESEIITLGVYDIDNGTTVWMDVTDFDEERYLTNITWSPQSDRIFIQVLDRAQKNMHLNMYNVDCQQSFKKISSFFRKKKEEEIRTYSK